MKNSVVIAFGILLCIQLQASDSPKMISNNFSGDDLAVLKDKNNNFDEDEFYDAQEDSSESLEQNIPLLQAKDIEALDQYSGLDEHFDRLYKFAKRDLYLAQQNEQMFPDKAHSYENLKKYYQELFGQRKKMATVKKKLSENLIDLLNKERLDQLMLSQEIQNKLTDLKNKRYKIYHENVGRSMNPKLLIDYKLPYNIQLQINDIDLQIAQLIVDGLYHS